MQNEKYGNSLTSEDAKTIIKNLGVLVEHFSGKKVLITGYRGFLGANFLSFFYHLKEELNEKVKIYCIDNLIVDLEDVTKDFIQEANIIHGNCLDVIPDEKFDYIIHCAGIASPTFYRKHPLETIKVNAIEYWELLDKINLTNLKGFLYFSTSEIYGDPNPKFIPTDEDYRGNVSCIGPRACYDESKRLGETISVSIYQEKKIPIKIVRPFNVYGPFMRKEDKRVIPDFLKVGLEEKKIILHSDGTPTRAFCYVSDAVEGFLRVLLIGKPARPYNIGNDKTEISMKNMAQLISELLGNIKLEFKTSNQKDYLTDNPQKRCPVILRAKKEVHYQPQIDIKKGLERMIKWYKEKYFYKEFDL